MVNEFGLFVDMIEVIVIWIDKVLNILLMVVLSGIDLNGKVV